MDKEDIELSALVKTQANYYKAPHDLHSRIGAALAQAGRPKIAPAPKPAWYQWWGMGAAFAAGVMLAITGMFTYNLLAQQDQIAEQVVDSHVRSLMVAHLSDVASSDQHTVKPWFDGKLDYSPPVQDLVVEGYPLIGGRLDYLNGQPVAALVYRHRLHAINVFVWPVRSKTPFVSMSSSKQGFNFESWREDGMEFWAVSDVQSADLQTFTRLLQAKDRRQ